MWSDGMSVSLILNADISHLQNPVDGLLLEIHTVCILHILWTVSSNTMTEAFK